MRWLDEWFFFWLLMGLTALIVVGGIFVAIVGDGDPAEAPPDPAPIGYTLYDVTNNRVIDIQPCPHSWRLAPDWYSTDQWMPGFGRKYDFGYGVATPGGILAELKPVGYEAPASCGPAYE